MRVPLLQGRWFSDDDLATTEPVAVIDDVLARAYWPSQNPIGQKIRSGNDQPWERIVGVVRHVRRDSLELDENKGVVYRPFAQNPVNDAALIVRTAAAPESIKGTLSSAVNSTDSSVAIYDVRTLSSMVTESLASRQLLVWLLSAFGGVALTLAAIGIYGLLSSTASERTAEIGIRMALGAQRSQVVFLVLRDTLALIGVGLAAGLALASIAERVLANTFAAMEAGTLPSLAVATVFLLCAAAIAAFIPALRSASIDPVIALKQE
jgi:ABC-type antimicrobial peptide transport system permease subunit